MFLTLVSHFVIKYSAYQYISIFFGNHLDKYFFLGQLTVLSPLCARHNRLLGWWWWSVKYLCYQRELRIEFTTYQMQNSSREASVSKYFNMKSIGSKALSTNWTFVQMVDTVSSIIRKKQHSLLVVAVIINFRVLQSEVLDVVDFFLVDNSSTNWAFFFLWQLVLEYASELISLRFSLHEPISVEADQVEAVVAGVNPHQISPLGKLLLVTRVFLLLFLISCGLSQGELLEADGASAPTRVIVLGEYLTDILVEIEEEALAVFVLTLLGNLLTQSLIHFLCDLVLLLIVDTFDLELVLWNVEWVELVEDDLALVFESDFRVVSSGFQFDVKFDWDDARCLLKLKFVGLTGLEVREIVLWRLVSDDFRRFEDDVFVAVDALEHFDFLLNFFEEFFLLLQLVLDFCHCSFVCSSGFDWLCISILKI